MVHLLLSGQSATHAAVAVEEVLRAHSRNSPHLDVAWRQLAAALALAVPLTSQGLPCLLAAAGPEATAAVKAEVRRIAGSRFDIDRDTGEKSSAVTMPASKAAQIAGVSSRAIRAAAADGRLAATKDQNTGTWRITTAGLYEWQEKRHAA